MPGFPPRSAGASLKRGAREVVDGPLAEFSPAFSGGLIEASLVVVAGAVAGDVFPRVQRGPH